MHPLEKAAVFVFLLATLIFVHELGHFLVAKLFRVKVLRFSLGFGPRLLSFKWGDTEYQIAALPFGGYVRMAGDDPTEEPAPEDRGRGFLEQPPWKRGLIAFAGPAMSLLFPVLVYFVAFYFKAEEVSSRIGHVEPDRPAWAAGLRAGDRILAIDGRPVRYFHELSELIAPRWEQPVEITYERWGTTAKTVVVPEREERPNPLETEVRGIIGVGAFTAAPLVGIPGPETPAALAGLQTFDRIVKVGDRKIETWPDLEAALAGQRGPVSVTVVRDEAVGGAAGPLTSYRTFETTLAPRLGEGRADFGIEPIDLYLFSVEEGSPAWQAGLRRGDRLVSLDGTALNGWTSFERMRRARGEQPFVLGYLQNGERVERTVQQKNTVEIDEFDNRIPVLKFGAVRDERQNSFVPGERIALDITVTQALVRAARVVPDEIRKTVLAIAGLFTGSLSVKNLGGPIMMYQVAVRSAELGWDYFLRIMGFISINLGLMNLLPIPVLDGFHILSAGFESVRRRPMSMRARMIAAYVGLALLVGLMLLAMRNDLMRVLG